MEEKPLDLAEHEKEAPLAVWKRRALFVLLIVLCVAFAYPVSGSCSGALGTGGSPEWGTFKVGGKERVVREEEFRRTFENLDRVYSVLLPGRERREMTNEQVWDHILLDELAKAEGVHVSDAQIRDFLAGFPDFQTAGDFDEQKYRAFLREMAAYGGFNHETFTTTLRSMLRRRTYERVFQGVSAVASSPEAYEAWKKENLRVSADWVARPYEDLQAKAEAEPVTEQDLRAVAAVPEVLAMRRVPARRSLEAAVILVREVTPEQRKAMEETVVASGVLPRGHTLDTLSWQWYWGNQKAGDAFSRENWLRAKRKEYADLRARFDEEHKAWAAKPEAERGEEPKPPADPSAEPWPEQPREVYAKHFADRVRSEVLAREVIREFALRAERESKSFAELGPDYAKFGLRVVATPEPLADADLVERFPEGLGRDSEVEQVVRGQFRMPEAGTPFTPKIHAEPVPTTRLAEKIDARGFLALRWSGLEPSRERDVLEVREKVEEFVRRRRTIDGARDSLAEVQKKVEAAGADAATRAAALRAEVAAAGIGEVRTLRRFHRDSARSAPAASGPGAAAAERRNRVQADYAVLSRTEVGKFRDPILLDDSTKAAYLILVTEHHEPTPAEMDENTMRVQRMRTQFREQERLQTEVLGGEALRRRCGLTFSPEYLKENKPREDAPAR